MPQRYVDEFNRHELIDRYGKIALDFVSFMESEVSNFSPDLEDTFEMMRHLLTHNWSMEIDPTGRHYVVTIEHASNAYQGNG